MRKLLFFGLLIGLVVFLSSCSRYASEKDFDSIALFMDKDQVREKMSSNGVARGSIINKYNQKIEVREYKVDVGKTSNQLGQEIAFTVATLGLGAPIFCTHGDRYLLALFL